MIKVLMVGPGKGVVGGISAVTNTIAPILSQEVNYQHLPTTKDRLNKGDAGKMTFRNILAVIRQYLHFLWVLIAARPQIVHLHTSQASAWIKDTYFILVGRLFRVPVVLHVHAAEMDVFYSKRHRLEKWYTRQAMGRANVVIAVSEQWRQSLSEIVPIERIETFRNCIDVRKFNYHHEPAERVNILFLGSVGPRKGFYDLVDAAKILKENGRLFNMWLAGYEEINGELARATQKIAAMGLTDFCHPLGIVLGEEKKRLINEAHISSLPSYNEGLPIAVLEALAAGLPVVTTPVGGIPEVVKNGHNGFLVQPGDVEMLAEKLDLLIQNLELRDRIGQTNRQYAEMELDVRPYVEKLLDLYEMQIYGTPSSFLKNTA